ncbi:hypothetical protein LUZ62_076337 [Rhynchospora pubera]|uniref:Uncharacterized protein n=1 Tax=Rhynchospora pubera TaxID=906938 RepID=A0AAV8DI18_9POAL|nr:hypothetical protein LUZ62_076337 [Rhynchospora pubera]
MDSKSSACVSSNELPTEPASDQQPSNSGFCLTFSFFPTIAFFYLTYNFGLAAYRSRTNPWDLAFIISCYLELILLFLCLKKHENLTSDSPNEQRDRLKVVVWILCTLFTFTFAWRISQIMPWYLNVIIWGMSASVILVGFYFFFLFKDDDAQLTNKYSKLNSHDTEENGLCKLSPEEKV